MFPDVGFQFSERVAKSVKRKGTWIRCIIGACFIVIPVIIAIQLGVMVAWHSDWVNWTEYVIEVVFTVAPLVGLAYLAYIPVWLIVHRIKYRDMCVECKGGIVAYFTSVSSLGSNASAVAHYQYLFESVT